MGSGKTSYFIDHLNEESWSNSKQKYIFITPNLNEVDRITAACPALHFKNPIQIHGKKYWGFKELIEDGDNICTTHALFRMLGRDIQAELKKHHYRLIIDEALDVVELYKDLSPQDFQMLVKDGWITVHAGTGLLHWDESRPYVGKHSSTRELCLNGSLVSQGEKLILWEFPVSFLDCFESVTILTYCFHGSHMAAYLAAADVGFDMKAVHGGKLIDWHDVDERHIKDRLRGLITVYEGRSNAVGNAQTMTGKATENALSSSWYLRQVRGKKEGLATLKKGLVSFFQNEAKTPSELNLWTTFKDYKGGLKGRGYSKGFVPNNLRATNEFKHKRSAAYTCNTFMHPVVKQYLSGRGVTVYEDLFSLSEILQWIWRTGIREYQPIHLYIPSQRMRGLFHAWLKADTTADLFGNLGLSVPTTVAV